MMPTYLFKCSLCGHVFDESMPIHNYAVMSKGKMKFKCPSCNKNMNPTRVLSSPAVIYKGDGFYSTSNRKSDNNESS